MSLHQFNGMLKAWLTVLWLLLVYTMLALCVLVYSRHTQQASYELWTVYETNIHARKKWCASITVIIIIEPTWKTFHAFNESKLRTIYTRGNIDLDFDRKWIWMKCLWCETIMLWNDMIYETCCVWEFWTVMNLIDMKRWLLMNFEMRNFVLKTRTHTHTKRNAHVFWVCIYASDFR